MVLGSTNISLIIQYKINSTEDDEELIPNSYVSSNCKVVIYPFDEFPQNLYLQEVMCEMDYEDEDIDKGLIDELKERLEEDYPDIYDFEFCENDDLTSRKIQAKKFQCLLWKMEKILHHIENKTAQTFTPPTNMFFTFNF